MGRALTVALCFAVAVLEGYDIQAVGVTARKIAGALLLAPADMGLVFAVSNVGLIAGASVGGWLADRVGRKPVLIGSVVTFGIFTLATMLAHNFDTMFAARLLAGLGFGGAIPNMMAIGAEVSGPRERASTAAMMFCGMPVGGALAALFTSSLPADFDWRLVFLVGGALPLLVAPLLLFGMRETHPPKAERASPRVLFALFGEGRLPATLLLWIAFFPTMLILYLMLNWLPTLVVDKGLSDAIAPQASLAFNVAGVIGALLFGFGVDRGGTRWPFLFAYAALAVSALALAGASAAPLVMALSGAAGFFLLGGQYALYGIAASYYPAAVRATGSGVTTAIGRIGSIVGPMAAGQFLAAGASASEVITLLAPLAALAGIAVFWLSFFGRAD